MQTFKSEAFHKGLESKRVEIREMGFEAARDKFNLDNPAGQRWTGTADGLQFALGEFEALTEAAH